MTNADEVKRMKARNLRYKKPIVKDLNIESIYEKLQEITDGCDEVRYFFEEDDGTLLNAMCGDEEEEHEFRMAFADLCAESDQMWDDLRGTYIPKCFDQFFAAIGGGELIGWDAYEGDYFGLNTGYEERLAKEEARKQIMRMTKEEIMSAAEECFKIVRQYIGLMYRYDCLKVALDVLKEENKGKLELAKRVNEKYEAAEKEGFYAWDDNTRQFDELLKQMPREVWVW